MGEVAAAVASGPAAQAAERVALILHGYGADERDLIPITSFLPPQTPWVSLRAPERHPAFGYQWYPLTSLETQPADAVEGATAAVWSWIDANLAPEARLIPIGFSQGGLMASQLLRTRPERIDATVLLSGFVLDAAQPADDALATERPAVFWGRGAADPMIPPHAIAYAQRWLGAHAHVESRVYPGLGHGVSEDELDDMRAFLAASAGAGGTAARS